MKFFLTARFDDGNDIEVTAGPRDQLAWEKSAGNRALSQLLSGDYRIADLYSLAHAALKRQGLYSGTLKDFEESADVEMGHKSKGEDAAEVDDADENPTQPGPSDDN